MVILCTIDLETREVSLPAGQVIASYDHNVDVIRFQAEAIPGFSLDTSSIRIAAQGPNKARHDYAVDPSTVAIEEETGYITFDWPIPAGVTEMPIGTFKYGDKGQLIFAVCAEIISGDTVSKAWHSDDGIITVVAHLEPESGGGEDPEEEATNAQKIAQLQTNVAVMGTQIGALANGSPTPVETIAEMTDESAVYLYTGSETGYTAGNWYYYDGTAWTSGGTYGGAVTDTTLSISGAPADAKAVGDALAEKADSDDVESLAEDIDDLREDLSPSIYNIHLYETGGYVKADGTFAPYTGWTRTDYIDISMCKSIVYETSVKSIYNAFYDSNKDFISAFALNNGLLNNNLRTVTVPSNAVYMVLSNTDAGMASTKIYPASALANISNYNLLNGLLTGEQIELERRGTDIYINFVKQAFIHTVRYYGNFTYGTIASGQNFTIPNGSYLVYNMETSSISVMTFAQIQQTDNSEHLVVLMCNNNGTAVGCIEQAKNKDDLPYYYRAYMAAKTTLINQNKATVGLNGFSFIFITDEHIQQNEMKSSLLIKNIRENTSIDTIVQGGDIITIEAEKTAVYKDISEYISYLEDTGCKVYSAIGNHEYNNPNASREQAAMDVMLTLNEVASCLYIGNVYNDCVFDKSSLAYYKDFSDTRVFFLPCHYGSGIYIAPVKWILSQLAEVPENHHVVVVSHVIAEWVSDMSQATINSRLQALIDGLDALKAKQAYTYDGTTYDYTNKNVIPVCVIGGHAHVDYDWTSTGGIPVIVTTSDSGQQESGGLTRTAYTTNEQAFDVVTADYTTRKLYLTRIGAGQNREFDF